MRMVDLIQKKRDGLELTDEEIHFIIDGYTKDIIPDYQMSAWMMAICFQGLNKRETASLTLEMMHSGDIIDLSAIQGIKADKHSTGGVGDKTSLVLGPIVAACGVPVAKMSVPCTGFPVGICWNASWKGVDSIRPKRASLRRSSCCGCWITAMTVAGFCSKILSWNVRILSL